MTGDDFDGLDERFAHLYKDGRGREEPEDHPSPETLSAYQAGELPPGEREVIEEHLSRCNVCTELLLDLQSFLEPGGEDAAKRGGKIADLRSEAGWREVRGMLPLKAEQGSRKPIAAEVARLRRSLRAYQAIAAVLLVGVVGTSMYSLHLRREPSFEMNPVAVSLGNELGMRDGGDEPPSFEVSPRSRLYFLLAAPPDGPSRGYRVEVHDARGRTVFGRDDLLKQGDIFSFALPAMALETGRYEIRVLTLATSRLIGRYSIMLISSSK